MARRTKFLYVAELDDSQIEASLNDIENRLHNLASTFLTAFAALEGSLEGVAEKFQRELAGVDIAKPIADARAEIKKLEKEVENIKPPAAASGAVKMPDAEVLDPQQITSAFNPQTITAFNQVIDDLIQKSLRGRLVAGEFVEEYNRVRQSLSGVGAEAVETAAELGLIDGEQADLIIRAAQLKDRIVELNRAAEGGLIPQDQIAASRDEVVRLNAEIGLLLTRARDLGEMEAIETQRALPGVRQGLAEGALADIGDPSIERNQEAVAQLEAALRRVQEVAARPIFDPTSIFQYNAALDLLIQKTIEERGIQEQAVQQYNAVRASVGTVNEEVLQTAQGLGILSSAEAEILAETSRLRGEMADLGQALANELVPSDQMAATRDRIVEIGTTIAFLEDQFVQVSGRGTAELNELKVALDRVGQIDTSRFQNFDATLEALLNQMIAVRGAQDPVVQQFNAMVQAVGRVDGEVLQHAANLDILTDRERAQLSTLTSLRDRYQELATATAGGIIDPDDLQEATAEMVEIEDLLDRITGQVKEADDAADAFKSIADALKRATPEAAEMGSSLDQSNSEALGLAQTIKVLGQNIKQIRTPQQFEATARLLETLRQRSFAMGNQFVRAAQQTGISENAIDRLEDELRQLEQRQRIIAQLNNTLGTSFGRMSGQADRLGNSARNANQSLGQSLSTIIGFGGAAGVFQALTQRVIRFFETTIQGFRNLVKESILTARNLEVTQLSLQGQFTTNLENAIGLDEDDAQAAGARIGEALSEVVRQEAERLGFPLEDAITRILAQTGSLEKAIQVAELIPALSALAPDLPVSRAIVSTLEAAAGDIRSLRLSFEVDTSEIERLKKEGLSDVDALIQGLGSTLEGYGSTLEQQQNSVNFLVNRSREFLTTIRQAIGDPLLEEFSEQLRKITDFFTENRAQIILIAQQAGSALAQVVEEGGRLLDRLIGTSEVSLDSLLDWFLELENTIVRVSSQLNAVVNFITGIGEGIGDLLGTQGGTKDPIADLLDSLFGLDDTAEATGDSLENMVTRLSGVLGLTREEIEGIRSEIEEMDVAARDLDADQLNVLADRLGVTAGQIELVISAYENMGATADDSATQSEGALNRIVQSLIYVREGQDQTQIWMDNIGPAFGEIADEAEKSLGLIATLLRGIAQADSTGPVLDNLLNQLADLVPALANPLRQFQEIDQVLREQFNSSILDSVFILGFLESGFKGLIATIAEGGRLLDDFATGRITFQEFLEAADEAGQVTFAESFEETLAALEEQKAALDENEEALNNRKAAMEESIDLETALADTVLAGADALRQAAKLQEESAKILEDANQKRAEALEDLETDLAEKKLDIEKKFADRAIDDAIKLSRKREDIERDRLKAIRDALTKNNQEIEDAARDLDRDLEDIARKGNRKEAEIEEEGADKRLDIEREYQNRLEDLRRKFAFDAQEAIRDQDAIRFLQLRRQLAFDLEQARIERDRDLVGVDVDLDRRREELRRSLAAEREDARINNERKLEDLRIALQREKAEIEQSTLDKREEAKIAAEREREDRLKDYDRAYRDLAEFEKRKKEEIKRNFDRQIAETREMQREILLLEKEGNNARLQAQKEFLVLYEKNLEDSFGRVKKLFGGLGSILPTLGTGGFGFGDGTTTPGFGTNDPSEGQTSIAELRRMARLAIQRSGLPQDDLFRLLAAVNEMTVDQLMEVIKDPTGYPLTGLEHGGPFSAGELLLVGEAGPEIVQFKRPGHVIPNHAIGRAVHTPEADVGDLSLHRVPNRLLPDRDMFVPRIPTLHGGGQAPNITYNVDLSMLEPDALTPTQLAIIDKRVQQLVMSALGRIPIS